MKYLCGYVLAVWIIVLPSVELAVSQNLLDGPEDIIFDVQSKRMLVSNWVSGVIVEIDSNFTQSYFKTGLSHAHGMELLGDTLYVASNSRIIGIRLADAQTLFQIDIPVASRLGHITIDDSLNLYASDWSVHKIFKVNLAAQTYSTIVESGIDTPVGIMLNREASGQTVSYLQTFTLRILTTSEYYTGGGAADWMSGTTRSEPSKVSRATDLNLGRQSKGMWIV